MAEQLFQIAAKALIRDADGKILMVHIPEWSGIPAHWDLPGGRMDPGETFLETLSRELTEEIGVAVIGAPKQLMGMLTNITIPVGGGRVPLVFMIYQTEIDDITKVKLAEDTRENDLAWFAPAEAAEHMAVKFTPEFRDLVKGL